MRSLGGIPKRLRGLPALLLVACGGRENQAPGLARAERPAVVESLPAPAPPPPLYDASGHLLGSGEHIDWLELPRGFKARGRPVDSASSFDAEGLDPERVRAFLSAQLITGSAEEVGKGVVYRGAAPLDGRPDAVRLDIELLVDRKGKILLIVRPATFPSVPRLPEAELERQYTAEQRRAE